MIDPTDIPREPAVPLAPRPPIDDPIEAGVELHKAGRHEDAEAIYRRVLRERPDDADALQYLGLLLAQRGNSGEATVLFEKAVSSRPQAPLLRYNLGKAYESAGRRTEAIRSYRCALERDAEYVEAHLNLGNALKSSGEIAAAVDCYRRALAIRPDFVPAHVNLGLACQALGRRDEALGAFERALRIDPESAPAHYDLGCLLLEMGSTERAVHHFEHAARRSPHPADALDNLGSALLKLGRIDEAIERFHAALVIRPDDGRTHHNLGTALADRERLDEAIASYREALRLEPGLAEGHNNLGCALLELDRVDEALACFRRALRLRPDYPEPHANASTALAALGRFREAEASASRALELSPGNAKAYFHLANVQRLAPGDARVAKMEELLRHERASSEDRMYLSFALGKVYDAAGREDEAFGLWADGNRRKRARLDYSARRWRQSLLRIERNLSRTAMAERFGGGEPSDLPIFIVGMPRSGTTLVEQILASHPGVHGAGELPTLGRIAADLRRDEGYLDGPRLPPQRALAAAGRRYVETLRARDGAARRVTNKLPENFIHLGLIALALPGARIVHCLRDPLDTCLSCYSILFSGDNQPFTYDLEELGSYHRSYERLMAHWRRALPAPTLDVRYEDLVSNQEEITRKLLAFCGLPWDDRCVAFHRTERPVRTASNLQVRQPIYERSVGRWRRYEAHLEPLKRALGRETR